MKEVLKFQVTVEKGPKDWIISEMFDSYDAAQQWRHEQEAQLLKADPNRSCVRSNLLFVREVVEGA
ncbi:MAG: hypothetical protein VZQ98_15395 [Bacteroidales bacterium]|nr:hypothetical protein [Bacteroidales bacterium]